MQQILHARSEEKVRKQNESIRDEMMLDLQQRIADIDENHRKKDTPSTARYCRCGAGTEATPDKCDTPGFDISNKPSISKARGGYNQLLLERNDKRTVQTSMYQAQSWRGNVDCQIIILDATADDINMEEMRRVCEYIIAYATKAAEKEQDSMQSVKALIDNMEAQFSDQSDVTRAVRRVMNLYTASKTISKQEAMVLMAKLKLYSCSEMFHNVSTKRTAEISSESDENSKRRQDILTMYENRPEQFRYNSLHEFFHLVKNKDWKTSGKRMVVPHYIFGGCQVRLPLSEADAEHIYKIYVPWTSATIKGKDNFVKEIEECLRDRSGRYKRLQMTYFSAQARQLEQWYYRNREPVADQPHFEPPANYKGMDADQINEFEGNTDTFQHMVFIANACKKDGNEYNIGYDYAWDEPVHPVPTMDKYDVATWLEGIIEERQQETAVSKEGGIVLPMFGDKEYDWKMLDEEQKHVAYKILSTIRKWLTGNEDYVPLRLTVCGGGGTGKSVIIKMIVTAMRKLFNTNDAVHVFAPTGSAAHNVDGKTPHSFFGVNTSNSLNVSDYKKKKLRLVMKYTSVILLDERSLLDAHVLGCMENTCSQVVGNGAYVDSEHGWGNLPVVVLFGDDFQLPSIMPGAFFFEDKTWHKKQKNKIRLRGMSEFKRMGSNVSKLKVSKRVHESQVEFKEILEVLRGENPKPLTEKQIQRLMSLHLTENEDFTIEMRKTIKKSKCIHMFSKKKDEAIHNMRLLKSINDADHPVAALNAHKTGICACPHSSDNKGCFHKDNKPDEQRICIDAMVRIKGRNFMPEWGLYNGSMGLVKDIVYKDGESALHNKLPLYVLVDVFKYKGPPLFDPVKFPERKTWVPIPTLTGICPRSGATMTYVPLLLAFGRTTHSSQGMSVGKTRKGQCKNMLERCVVDIGEARFENNAPGLLYTALSRATTIGQPDDIMSSAIYFEGCHMSVERLRNVNSRLKLSNEAVKKRRNWVRYLNKHVKELTEEEVADMDTTAQWIEETRLTPQAVIDRLG